MPSFKELEKWLSTGQVAKRLGKSRQGVLWLAEAKKLRAVKVACGWIFDPASVSEYAEKHGRKGKEAR